MQALIYIVVIVTALGIAFQCLSNYKAKHTEFLSFPIAVLIQFPYPMWAILSWLQDNDMLLMISIVMGIPTACLSAQYFIYHGWPLRKKAEDKLTLGLSGLGLVGLLITAVLSGIELALSLTAAYFTCVISVFSYLVKIWRVAKAHETLDGLRWPTLSALLVFYCVMLMVGWQTGVSLLFYAYIFSVFACALAVLYKAFEDKSTRSIS